MMSSKVWISWEYQPRNRSMAKCLDAKCFEVVVASHRIKRYLLSIIKTLIIFKNEKPSVVFVQNPSIVLSILALICRPVWSFNLIVDQHNSGLFPLEGKSMMLNFLSSLIIRYADLNIVTNESLADYANQKLGKTVVAPDPLPNMKVQSCGVGIEVSKNFFNILFVCSWNEDEPFYEVIESIKYVSSIDVKIYISGDYTRSLTPEFIERLPENVELTGHISYPNYCQLMNDVDAVIVLTKRSSCLNCGLYEALSLDKPGLITNDRDLINYFSKGYIATEIDPLAIAKNIDRLNLQYSRLLNEVRNLKEEVQKNYSVIIKNLKISLEALEV